MVPDVAETIISLIFSGTTSRYPDEKWVFSHAGGTMPFLIERFLNGTDEEVVPGVVPKGPVATALSAVTGPRKFRRCPVRVASDVHRATRTLSASSRAASAVQEFCSSR